MYILDIKHIFLREAWQSTMLKSIHIDLLSGIESRVSRESKLPLPLVKENINVDNAATIILNNIVSQLVMCKDDDAEPWLHSIAFEGWKRSFTLVEVLRRYACCPPYLSHA